MKERRREKAVTRIAHGVDEGVLSGCVVLKNVLKMRGRNRTRVHRKLSKRHN